MGLEIDDQFENSKKWDRNGRRILLAWTVAFTIYGDLSFSSNRGNVSKYLKHD